MKLYHFLDKVPAPRSYVGKFLVLCFLGTHAPLVAFAVYAVALLPFDNQLARLSILILIATLGGTAATLLLVRGLLSPIVTAERSLKAYISDGIRPQLPTSYRDEAGRLLAEIQHVVDHLENCLVTAERRAMTDPLTTVGNRRWLTIEGEKALALARRSQAPLSVVMFDIDHFKVVNDRFGHAAGDDVLREITRATRAILRVYDLFARVGGEEFCIILPHTESKSAQVIAERLRAYIAQLPHPGIGSHTVTASFGIAALTPNRQTLTQLFADADIALYTAKEAGRNQVCTVANDGTGRPKG